MTKRRCRSRQRPPSKPPVQYSTGSSVRPMPASRGGFDQRQRHLGGIGVGLAVGLVVQVVELADLRVAGLEHLDVDLRRDRVDVVRIECGWQSAYIVSRQVQKLSSSWVWRSARARHRALERVRVPVRHARQHVAAEVLLWLTRHILADLRATHLRRRRFARSMPSHAAARQYRRNTKSSQAPGEVTRSMPALALRWLERISSRHWSCQCGALHPA